MTEPENYLELRVGRKYCKVELREGYIDAIDANDAAPLEALVARLVRAVQIGRALDKQKEKSQ